MATLSPSSWNTPAGYDGWYYVITLSVASTSGSTVKVNYRVNAGPRPSGAGRWYRTSALTFSVNGNQIDSKPTEYVETDTAGRLMMSGSFSVTGTSFTVSFTGDFWYNAGTGCNDTQTVQVKGLTYTVTFDLAGGTRTGGGALTQTVTAGGNATPPTCKRTGYDFDGWSGSYTNVTSNRTITAQWSRSYYTVTFDLDGGTRTGGGALSQSVVYGGNATPPTCSRSGYTFAGWNGSYTNVTSNRTITAKWTGNTYTVTYNANGGTGAPASQTKTHGQNLTLSSTKPTASWTLTYNANGGSVSPTSKSLSRPFRTWNTRADGTGTNYAAGATYTGNAPLTLYAQYNNPTAGTLPTPTRSNCTFNKWTTAQNSGSTVTSYTTITRNTTIYAFWNYGVIRHGNGGFIQIYDPHEETVMVQNEQGELVEQTITVDYRNVETATAYVAHGISYTIPNDYVSVDADPDQPIAQTFQGWSTSSSGSVQYQNGQSLTITGVTNLYAIFKTKSYTVTFVDGFGINSKSFTVQHGQTSPLPDGTADGTTDVATSNKWVQGHWAKHNGYTFTGWLGNYRNVTGDRTITALWGFTPVWIRKNGQWVAYRAREED